jgi:hypothetical protein
MVEIRDSACFAFEASPGFEIGSDLRKQDLDRHPSAKADIFCPVHFTHAACAEKGFKAIGAQRGASLETLGRRQSFSNSAERLTSSTADS